MPMDRLASTQQAHSSMEKDDDNHAKEEEEEEEEEEEGGGGGGGGGGKDTGVWWLGAVLRYVVATLVTVLTIAVIIRAIAVSRRKEKLSITIDKGYVLVRAEFLPPKRQLSYVDFTVSFKIFNPSARVGVRYGTYVYPPEDYGYPYINISFLDNKSVIYSSFTYALVLPPRILRHWDVYVATSYVDPVIKEFARTMKDMGELNNTTVLLSAFLQSQISGNDFADGHSVQYYCYPVTLGTSEKHEGDDVQCYEGNGAIS